VAEEVTALDHELGDSGRQRRYAWMNGEEQGR
jgi:hypothetical protein